MRAEVLRLLARYLLLAVAVILLNFFIPRLLPGDPLDFSAGEGMDSAVPLTSAAREQLRTYYNLDQPMSIQLLSYLGGLIHGDLGWSIAHSAPVHTLILDRLLWTLGLLLAALLISAVAGAAFGLAAGWFPGKVRDRLLVAMSSSLAAVPEFLVAIGLLLVFAIGFGWFPLLGGRTVFAGDNGQPPGLIWQILDIGWHLTLPAAALVLTGVAGFLLLARDATIGIHRELWLTVARSKGLRERRIALRHALPNVLLPLLTFFGLQLGNVLGGALVVERVFIVPGLGMLAFEAIRARDYPVLQAVFLLSSLSVLFANLLVEFAYLHLERKRGFGHG